MLACHDITKGFNGDRILKSVTLSLQPGSVTVLVGPSGSGKTTLLRALSLLDPPETGRVVLDQATFVFPKPGLGRAQPWPRVTVVFQQLFLWPHLTLRENINLALLNTGVSFDEAATEICEKFRISRLLDRRPSEVSIGERQRAALARAVALNPSYLLLDEITSALDVEQAQSILRCLLGLRDRGIGMLLITHHLGFAKALIGPHQDDSVAFLDDGIIVESGRPEILDNPATERFRRFLTAMNQVS